jgi:hypothetical protein
MEGYIIALSNLISTSDKRYDLKIVGKPYEGNLKIVGKPYEGKPHVRLCVQKRLACSVGVSPTGVTVRSPVAWMAGMRETDNLKPIDKATFKSCEQVTGL